MHEIKFLNNMLRKMRGHFVSVDENLILTFE
jgi:hypothetical protein